MESEGNTNCLVNCAVGVKDFIKSPEKETLEERLEKDGVQQRIRKKMEENYCGKSKQNTVRDSSLHNRQFQNEQPPRDLFVVGQDVATDSVKDLTDFLLKRDYLEVAEFDGVDDGDVGTITVPETYIPKKPRVVEPEIADEVIANNPEDTKLQVSF